MKRKERLLDVLYFCTGILIAIFSATFTSLYKLAGWVEDTWGLLSIDEIIFHLKMPLEGTNTDVIVDGINTCIPIALILLLMMLAYMIGMKRKKAVSTVSMVFVLGVSMVMTAKAGYGLYNKLDVGTYLKSQKQESTFIQANCVNSKEVSIIFPEQKRNLIYIILESMESTYASVEDGGKYEENYIPDLTAIAQNNINFSNTDRMGGAINAYGSAWTMAAIFAQTSGLPLKLADNVDDGNALLQENDSFSSAAYNLEDILSDNGYKQCFMLGSDATFGGRKAYFNSHGDCEIWDINTAKELGKLPEDYFVWWGYEDSKLFGYAKEKLLDLSSSPEPFNLTLLTVDTHFEDGYVCELCEDEFDDNQYANVLACSGRQVSEFIQWIQQQAFYENTTIVLCGDHLTMDSDFCDGIEYNERRVYNAFINLPEGLNTSFEKTHYREFTTMDMFPTTIAALGAKIEGDRLALGTNLFSNEQTLTEKYGIEQLNQELQKKSTFYDWLINDIDY